MEMFAVISVPAVICFCVGILLLIVEMFTPGMGFAGGIGIALLIAAVALQANSLEEALILMLGVVVIIGGAIFIFIRSANKGKLKRMVLNDSINDKGNDYTAYIGKTGIAQNDLHPAGNVLIDGAVLDVVASTGFVEKGTRIKVCQVDGLRIVVQKEDGK